MKTSLVRIKERLDLPRGFLAAGVAAGIKKNRKRDMAMLLSSTPATVAGTFTTNQVKAASVKLCMRRLRGGRGRAIVVNSGNANACTGSAGDKDALRMATLTARLLKLPANQVFVCSTGHIGARLPMPAIERGIRRLADSLSARKGIEAAHAIMTTDTHPKYASARIRVDGQPVLLSILAKGAGMIEPNMATMLCFILTDAAVKPAALQRALRRATEQSFNRITVDGDQSTNDTVLMLANGQAGNRPLSPGHRDWPSFNAALRALTFSMAMKMVRDGEGATKRITVRVEGARNDREAEEAARSVANSFLVKTSWHGDHPNWGRIMDALGYSRARVIEQRCDIFYNNIQAVKNGIAAGASCRQLQRIQQRPEFTIRIDLHLGKGTAVVYTCDCSEEYVAINV